jgi:glucan biosynthesis protein C
VQTQNESILSKYIYTVGITFFVTVLIYHLLVRPYALTRFLFGMKPLGESQEPRVKNQEHVAELEKLGSRTPLLHPWYEIELPGKQICIVKTIIIP